MPELACFIRGFIQEGTEISNIKDLLLHSRQCLSGWLHNHISAFAVQPKCFQLEYTAMAEFYL